MHKNTVKYYIYISLFALGNMFCTGSILQTFLLESGFTEGQVYLYNAMIQGVQVLTMFVMLFVSDKIRHIKQLLGTCLIVHTLLSAVLVGLSTASGNLFFMYSVYGVSALVYVATGIYGVINYCLPYRIIDMKGYGTLVAVSTAVSGLTTFAFSLLHSFAVGMADYSPVMMGFFLLASVCFAGAGFFCLSLKEINGSDAVRPKRGGFGALMKNPYTYVLMVPSFIRGMTMGVISLLTVIGFSAQVLNTHLSTYVNILLQVASFGGNVLFASLYKKLSSGKLAIISTAGITLFLPLILVLKNAAWFIIIYFIVYFFLMIFNTAVPVLIPDIVPKDQIGGFTSIRMMLYTAGSMVASLVIDPITARFGVTALLVSAAVIQLVCGVTHYATWRHSIKHRAVADAVTEQDSAEEADAATVPDSAAPAETAPTCPTNKAE